MTIVAAAAYYWRRPRELADRLANEWERRTEKVPAWTPPAGTGAGTATTTGTGDEAGVDVVHRLLGVDGAGCELCAAFATQVAAPVAERVGPAHYHDAGPATLKAAWSATRHLRPEIAVETGVARGLTAAAVLTAMNLNRTGRLWSIDLPEVALVRSGESAAAVTSELAERWDVRRGSSRRLLPSLFGELGPIDLFIHDSLHTRANMLFELDFAWDRLRPGGLVVVDDVGCNTAFAEFVERTKAPYAFGRRGKADELFGAVHKVAT